MTKELEDRLRARKTEGEVDTHSLGYSRFIVSDPLCVEAADTLKRYREALGVFIRAAYSVSEEINPRGHNWCEPYLDEALANARQALENSHDHD